MRRRACGFGGHFEIALVEEIADVAGLALDLNCARPDDIGAGDADQNSAIALGDVALFDGEDEVGEAFFAAEVTGDEIFDLRFAGEVEDAVLDGPDFLELRLVAGFGIGGDPDPTVEVFAVKELNGFAEFAGERWCCCGFAGEEAGRGEEEGESGEVAGEKSHEGLRFVEVWITFRQTRVALQRR